MPEWLTGVAIWAGARLWSGPPSCTCVVEQTRIQPELIELLARQLDRCGPANLTVPVCSACPPWPADNSLLLLLAGAVAGFSLGVAFTLLWTLLSSCDVRPLPGTAPVPSPAPAAPASTTAALSVFGASPAALGRLRAAPGARAAVAALRLHDLE